MISKYYLKYYLGKIENGPVHNLCWRQCKSAGFDGACLNTTCNITSSEVQCDVNADGKCTPADAFCIMNKYMQDANCIDGKYFKRRNGDCVSL